GGSDRHREPGRGVRVDGSRGPAGEPTGKPNREAGEEEGREGDVEPEPALPACLLAQPVEERAAPREDRPPVEEAPEVVGEGRRRGVARRGLLAQRLAQDRIQVAAQTGGIRLALVDRALERGEAGVAELVGLPPGQQLVEDDAERVDVRGAFDRLAAHLLGARVRRGHRPLLGLRRLGLRSGPAAGFEQPRDAEVEQLRLAPFRDQDVAGLQVAMDDRGGVRVLDRRENGKEQLDPGPQGSLDPRTVVEDRRAPHQLHREEGPSGRGDPRIVEAGDARMLEGGEDALLGAKAAEDRRVHPAADHLERHGAREAVPQLLGEIDRGAAPATDRLEDPVAGDRLGDLSARRALRRVGRARALRGARAVRRGGLGEPPSERAQRRPVERRRRALGGGEESAQLGLERRIAAARLADRRLPLAFRQVEDPVEGRAQPAEATVRGEPRRLRHGEAVPLAVPPSSWSSQARANAQSRFTVRGEQSSTAAASSTLRPPKKRTSTRRARRGSSAARRSSARSRSIISAAESVDSTPPDSASSNETWGESAPRFAAIRPRAWSTRMRRIRRDEKAKKWVRSCHWMSRRPRSFKNASWTRAVGWSVCPARSPSRWRRASRRSSR